MHCIVFNLKFPIIFSKTVTIVHDDCLSLRSRIAAMTEANDGKAFLCETTGKIPGQFSWLVGKEGNNMNTSEVKLRKIEEQQKNEGTLWAAEENPDNYNSDVVIKECLLRVLRFVPSPNICALNSCPLLLKDVLNGDSHIALCMNYD